MLGNLHSLLSILSSFTLVFKYLHYNAILSTNDGLHFACLVIFLNPIMKLVILVRLADVRADV